MRRPTRVEIATVAASAVAVVFGLAHADTPHMLGSLFGLAPQQAVRISVVSNDIPAIRGDTVKGESSCFVQLKIFAADGSVKVQSDYLKIVPGVAFSHDLKYEDMVGGSNPKLAATDFTNRTQVRVASYLSTTGIAGHKLEHKVGGCTQDYKFIKLGLEVFDTATGKTTFMVPTDSILPAVQ
jgi:hypothetical protein